MALVRAENAFGTKWFSGTSSGDGKTDDGPKSHMKAMAAATGARCLLQLSDPARGYRRFGCYRTWDEAIPQLATLPPHMRHMFEIIPAERPCKPYLDIDAPGLPPGFADAAALVRHYQRQVIQVFREDYHIQLRAADLHWSVSPKPDKLSLHLVVSTHNPQWVYQTNSKFDPQGARHLAMRLRELERGPDKREEFIDAGVYSRDREMRVVGATKAERPDSVLVPLLLDDATGAAWSPEPDGVVPTRDSLVTWLDDDDDLRFIAVPVHQHAVRGEKARPPHAPTEAHARRADGKKATDPPEAAPGEGARDTTTAPGGSGADFKALARGRFLDALRQDIHPSAILAPDGAAASALPTALAAELLALIKDQTLADYPTWLKVATACRFDREGDHEHLWTAFDERCKMAPRYDADNNRKMWRSLKDCLHDRTLALMARRDAPERYAALRPQIPDRLLTAFVYTDVAAERCCFGKLHADKDAGLACHLNTQRDILARCLHPACAATNKPPRKIGKMDEDDEHQLYDAINLNSEKMSLSAVAPGIGPAKVHDGDQAVHDDEASEEGSDAGDKPRSQLAGMAAWMAERRKHDDDDEDDAGMWSDDDWEESDSERARTLQRDADAAADAAEDRRIADAEAHVSDWNITPDETFNAIIARWAKRGVRSLSIRSPMGTGKTSLLQSILAQLPASTRVLVVSYRQTLALEQGRKLHDHGFVTYLNIKDHLGDRERYPRVICQVESLERTGTVRCAPSYFDLIVLDEIESLLRHFCSPTVKNPFAALDFLIGTINFTRRDKPLPRVITMDAFWGNCSFEFLRQIGVSNLLMNNLFRPKPRTFAFGNDYHRWLDDIIEDLKAGHNVIVASLSAQKVYDIQAAVLASEAIAAGDMLLHTSRSGDIVKDKLSDVDALWTQYRLVMYSPCVSAGVDFSAAHFHRLYIYVCPLSCTPLGALQMTGRVRSLADDTVRCCAARTMQITGAAICDAVTVEDTRQYLLWMDRKFRTRDYPMERKRVQGQPDGYYIAPVEGPLFGIEKYAETERFNAITRFFYDFKDMARGAGHIVRLEETRMLDEEGQDGPDASAAKRKADRTRYAVDKLLEAPDLAGEQLAAVRKRVFSKQATAEDVWIMQRLAYKTARGIDRIDRAFLEANGEAAVCPKTRQLILVLYPELRNIDQDCGVEERAAVNRIPYILETLEALGFRSPFDKDTRLQSLQQAWDARIKKTAMFAERESYSNVANLFGARGTISGDWDLRKITKSVNMVLGSIGIKLISSQTRPRNSEGKQKILFSDYRLCPDSVDNMLELSKLRLRTFKLRDKEEPENKHAGAALQACQLPKYGHLLVDQRAALRKFLFANATSAIAD